MNHILEILLAHQGDIYLLEEGLASWVNLDRLLELAEVSPGGRDDFVGIGDQCVLLAHLLEVLLVYLPLLCKHFVLFGLTLVHAQKLLDHIDIRQILNCFLQGGVPLLLGLFVIIKCLLNGNGSWHLRNISDCNRWRYLCLKLLPRLRQHCQLILLRLESLLGALILSTCNLKLLSVHIDVVFIGSI